MSVRQVDVDQSGSVNKREFIVCMRKVRDVELEVVKHRPQVATLWILGSH